MFCPTGKSQFQANRWSVTDNIENRGGRSETLVPGGEEKNNKVSTRLHLRGSAAHTQPEAARLPSPVLTLMQQEANSAHIHLGGLPAQTQDPQEEFCNKCSPTVSAVARDTPLVPLLLSPTNSHKVSNGSLCISVSCTFVLPGVQEVDNSGFIWNPILEIRPLMSKGKALNIVFLPGVRKERPSNKRQRGQSYFSSQQHTQSDLFSSWKHTLLLFSWSFKEPWGEKNFITAISLLKMDCIYSSAYIAKK